MLADFMSTPSFRPNGGAARVTANAAILSVHCFRAPHPLSTTLVGRIHGSLVSAGLAGREVSLVQRLFARARAYACVRVSACAGVRVRVRAHACVCA